VSKVETAKLSLRDQLKPGRDGALVGTVLDTLLRMGTRNNLTERVQVEIFEALQSHFPNLPSYPTAVRILEDRSSVRLSDFPTCLNECSVYRIPFGDIPPNTLKDITCPVCGLHYMNSKTMKYMRVRNQHASTCVNIY
jgi:hypothetical protein